MFKSGGEGCWHLERTTKHIRDCDIELHEHKVSYLTIDKFAILMAAYINASRG